MPCVWGCRTDTIKESNMPKELFFNKAEKNALAEELTFYESALHLPPDSLTTIPKLELTVELFSWYFVVKNLGAAAIAWAGTQALNAAFGSTDGELKRVTHNILKAVEQIVDQRFTQHELATLEAYIKSIVSNIRVFNNTPSEEFINRAIDKAIDAKAFADSHFKDLRATLSFRSVTVLAPLRVSVHQARMKHLYDEGKRRNLEYLIELSYGEINNVIDALKTMAHPPYPSDAWSIWNRSRFSELEQIPFFTSQGDAAVGWQYTFDGQLFKLSTKKYSEARRLWNQHMSNEYSQLSKEHVLPYVETLRIPFLRQLIYLKRIKRVFEDVKKHPPNYYNLKEYRELINLDSLPYIDNVGNFKKIWDDAENVMRAKAAESVSEMRAVLTRSV